MQDSCALDVADSGPRTFEEIGELMGFTKQRIHQLEQQACRKLARLGATVEAHGLSQLLGAIQAESRLWSEHQ